jgi:hypothetical protein
MAKGVGKELISHMGIGLCTLAAGFATPCVHGKSGCVTQTKGNKCQLGPTHQQHKLLNVHWARLTTACCDLIEPFKSNQTRSNQIKSDWVNTG